MLLIDRSEELEIRLRAAFGDECGSFYTTFAMGLSELIARDAVVSVWLGTVLFPALAVLYGTALRQTEASVNHCETLLGAGVELTAMERSAVERARRILAELPQIVEIARQPISQAAQEMTLSDAIQKIVAQARAVQHQAVPPDYGEPRFDS